jgi:uncharacterized protein (DUF983 family)
MAVSENDFGIRISKLGFLSRRAGIRISSLGLMLLNRPPASTLIYRALRLRCPRCGDSRMFSGLFRMHETCAHCGLTYEREPGYFLGSIYINYGITAFLTTVGWITLRFGCRIESRGLIVAFAAFCVLFPMFFFRYARALWLALDCQFDQSLFADPPAEEPHARR